MLSLLTSIAGLLAPALAALSVLRPLLGWVGRLLYHLANAQGEDYVAIQAAVDVAGYDELVRYERL